MGGGAIYIGHDDQRSLRSAHVGTAALTNLGAESSKDASITGLYSCGILGVPWRLAGQGIRRYSGTLANAR